MLRFKNKGKSCSIDGCDKPASGRGRCAAHYFRWRKHGDPLGGRTPSGEGYRFIKETVLTYEGEDCLIWPFGKVAGYGRVRWDGQDTIVSRLICELVNGPPPSASHEAAHLCGMGKNGCVAKRHVVWKTPAANQADRLAHGTHNRGERQGASKLTEKDVLRIRSLKSEMNQKTIAREYNIGEAQVSRIINRSTWSWL